MSNSYEVVVTRKLSNVFVVQARTGAEAAMKVGVTLAGADPWSSSTEVELGRQMRMPSLQRSSIATLEEDPDSLDLDLPDDGGSPVVSAAEDAPPA